MRINRDENRLSEWENVFEIVQNEPFTWGDIKDLNLEDDWHIQMDIFDEDYDGGYHYYFRAYKETIESDEEYAARMEKIKEIDKNTFNIHKANRYEQYLKLREEFEPGPTTI